MRALISKILSGSLFENSAAILLTRVSLSVSSLLITIFMARQLGAEQLGLFSIAMGLCAIFQLISILGYDTVVLREIARNKDKGAWLVQQGMILGVVSCVVCSLAMYMTGKILNYDQALMKTIFIGTLALFPSFFNVLGETIFIGLKKARYAFYTAVVRELIWLVLSLWWMGVSRDINAAMLAFLISRLAGMGLLAIFLLAENIEWRRGFHWMGIKVVIGLIPAFLLINLLTNLLLEVDIIVLSRMVSVADVGFYGMAKKILRVSFILIFSMVTAFFPSIVEAVHQSRDRARACFKEFSLKIFMLSGLIAATVCIFAHAIIVLFLGVNFVASVKFVHVLIWKILPLGLSFLWSRFLIAANHQGKDIVALMIGVPLFLVTGIVCVNKWGTIGMAYADVAVLTCLAVIHLYFVDRKIFRIGEIV